MKFGSYHLVFTKIDLEYTFLQIQRKYEIEADLRLKTESRLREVEEQLQTEISTRMQISSSSQHTNERINQLEKQVYDS